MKKLFYEVTFCFQIELCVAAPLKALNAYLLLVNVLLVMFSSK